MQSHNFVPSYRLARRRQRRRRLFWLCGCASYAILLLAGTGILYGVGSQDANPDDKVRLAESKIQQCSLAVERADVELSSIQEMLQVQQRVGDQPDWSLLLGLLSSCMSDDIVLRQYELKPNDPSSRSPPASEQSPSDSGAYVLRLCGYGRTQDAVSQFVLSLEKDGLFDQVKLIKTNSESFLAGKAVGFQIECLLSEIPR